VPENPVPAKTWLSVLRRNRSMIHWERRLFHATSGLLCFSLYAFILNFKEAALTLGIVGGGYLIFDILRLRSSKLNSQAFKVFSRILRREELSQLSASSYYILGLGISLVLFPKPITLLCCLYLAFGDPVAAIVGKLFGKNQLFKGKSLEGALANFIVSFFLTFYFSISYLHQNTIASIFLAVGGALGSTLAELLPLPWDDNITIPVFSGCFLYAWIHLL